MTPYNLSAKLVVTCANYHDNLTNRNHERTNINTNKNQLHVHLMMMMEMLEFLISQVLLLSTRK